MNEQFTKGPWLNNGRIIYRGADFIATASKTDIANFTEVEANAALIACAPEMYEMLQKLRANYNFSEYCEAEVDSLLAKARGES